MAGTALQSTTHPAGPAPRATDHATHEATTRERVLRLIVEEGPVSVVELALRLDLATAGVRRHVVALAQDGQITAHAVAASGTPRRGRPARRFVATDRGQAALDTAYPDLAAQVLHFLAATGGPEAITAFAERRVRDLELRLAEAMAAAVDQSVAGRTDALAKALAGDGYAASARPVPGGRAVQLCQGHCPVRDVAAQFPQLCEAETQLFSRLLGVHVQRLSTLARGGHVCTTHVPTTTSPMRAPADRPAPAETVEGTR